MKRAHDFINYLIKEDIAKDSVVGKIGGRFKLSDWIAGEAMRQVIKKKVNIRQTVGLICQSMGHEEVMRLTSVMFEAVDRGSRALGPEQLSLPTLVDDPESDDEETRRAPLHSMNPEYFAAVAEGMRRGNGLR